MRLLDKTMITEDEGYNLPSTCASWIKAYLGALNLDSYNAQYIVRITVDKVDEKPRDEDGDVIS